MGIHEPSSCVVNCGSVDIDNYAAADGLMAILDELVDGSGCSAELSVHMVCLVFASKLVERSGPRTLVVKLAVMLVHIH